MSTMTASFQIVSHFIIQSLQHCMLQRLRFLNSNAKQATYQPFQSFNETETKIAQDSWFAHVA
jgi:hypothetical protein